MMSIRPDKVNSILYRVICVVAEQEHEAGHTRQLHEAQARQTKVITHCSFQPLQSAANTAPLHGLCRPPAAKLRDVWHCPWAGQARHMHLAGTAPPLQPSTQKTHTQASRCAACQQVQPAIVNLSKYALGRSGRVRWAPHRPCRPRGGRGGSSGRRASASAAAPQTCAAASRTPRPGWPARRAPP